MNYLQIIFVILLTGSLYAEKVEVTSDSMNAKDAKKEVHFMGNVTVKEGKSWIHSDTLIVYFDENNETKEYQALGSATFELQKEKSHYKGSADKITYFPVKSEYILIGKAVVDDLINKRHVNGEKIILNDKTGDANVQGSRKKPVKFIFDMGNE